MDLLKTIRQVVIPGGIILNGLRGRITNQPKKSDLPDSLADETSIAHTIADDIVQEVALEILHSINPALRINAEEMTPRVSSFSGSAKDLCFHLDPLDGTFSYTKGRDGYAIGAAFSRNQRFIASAIYFPALDRLYLSERGQGVCVETGSGERLQFKPASVAEKKLVHKRADIFLPIVKELGLEEFDTMGAHHGMIALVEGEASVFLYKMASPHDVGIPMVILEEAGGVCTDINGDPIHFDSDFKRVPWFLAFHNAETRDAFFETREKLDLLLEG